MNISVLGTGSVGETIATALLKKGHNIKLGSRDSNNEKAQKWVKSHKERAAHGIFNEAAAFGDIVFICLNGEHALSALANIDKENLDGKIVVDVSNPLDFTQGMPPKILEDFRNESLGEKIQNMFPHSYVVKTLNTVNAQVMVEPGKINGGNHSLFICGNHTDSKNKIKHFLVDVFGWKPENFVDLGDIKASRVTEAYVPLWVAMWQAVGTPLFSVKLVQ